MTRRLAAISGPTVAIAAGLGTLGVSAYLFLLLAGQVLGDDGYAPLGALWILVFLVVPACLYPVEQELSRAIAARRAQGLGTGPLVRRAAAVCAGLTAALVGVVLAAGSVLDRELFDGHGLLLVGLLVALPSYALAYLARGVFAGNGRLGAYGVQLAGEGLWRLAGAVVLALVGVETAGPYGMLVGLAPLFALAVGVRGKRVLLDPGPQAEWRELTASLGYLVTAAVLSQVLVSAAPLIVKYAAGPGEQATAGAFAKAVVVTRIPLFMFQAVQAVLLPRLTHLATVGEHQGFRQALARVLAVVGALGAAGTVAAFAVGDQLLALFGSDIGLPRDDLTLLAAGNALFLVAMTTSQALVAVRRQAGTMVGWTAGLVAFAAVAAVPGDVLTRVEIALVVGSGVAVVVMLALVLRRLRQVETGAEDLVDALLPTHEIVEP